MLCSPGRSGEGQEVLEKGRDSEDGSRGLLREAHYMIATGRAQRKGREEEESEQSTEPPLTSLSMRLSLCEQTLPQSPFPASPAWYLLLVDGGTTSFVSPMATTGGLILAPCLAISGSSVPASTASPSPASKEQSQMY